MRVTKTIRAYIRENVEKKLEVKYASARENKKVALERQKEFIERAKEEAIKAIKSVLSQTKDNEFLVYDEEKVANVFRYTGLNNSVEINSNLHYERKMMDEVEKITNEIIVTLELGGNKADLDRMLSEIGKEEA